MWLTTNLNVVPWSRTRGAIPPLPQCAFMVWCSVKAQGLYFYLYYYFGRKPRNRKKKVVLQMEYKYFPSGSFEILGTLSFMKFICCRYISLLLQTEPNWCKCNHTTITKHKHSSCFSLYLFKYKISKNIPNKICRDLCFMNNLIISVKFNLSFM
jgi:hypothetical protein